MQQQITLQAIAFVKNTRHEIEDDDWGGVISWIELADHIPTEALDRISEFSHLEILYHFNQADPSALVYARRPRGNPAYPMMGIFAQRTKDRPNAIGLSTVELIEHHGRKIKVRNLDAIDGTPVLDIKPVFREFEPKEEIRQAAWVTELMKNYW